MPSESDRSEQTASQDDGPRSQDDGPRSQEPGAGRNLGNRRSTSRTDLRRTTQTEWRKTTQGRDPRHSGNDQPIVKTRRFNFTYVLLAILGVIVIHNLWMDAVKSTSIPYSEFQRLLRENKIASVVISENTISGELKEEAREEEAELSRFVTTRVDENLSTQLDEHGVEYKGRVENNFLLNMLSWTLPIFLFIGLWFFLLRRMMSRAGPGTGLMSIGRSKAKVYVEADTNVTFDDVAGVDEAKQELSEIVDFLRSPLKYGRLGARMPKGVLLVGPPGTGKTLLARAVAGEAAVPFFSISGSEFVEMFVGVGAARVRDLFEQARRQAPCIIFVDELDAMGRARGAHPGMGGHDVKEQPLNQLLVEMDGFDSTEGIILLAATNRPEVLDPALLRAGRFDRQVLVDRPDRAGRVAILLVHMQGVKLDDDVEPVQIAALTPGFTGADLANLINEAALLATRRGAERVAMQDFTGAIERIVAGLERKNRILNPHERRVVAHHEMGHALVAAALPGADPVHKVSIIPRGIGALGYTIQRPTDDRYLMTREELEIKMTVLLGGRAAERLIFGHLSTGAADDLQKVTDIARSMVTRYGMVPELGHVTFDSEPTSLLGQQMGVKQREYSEDTAREIDCAVRKIVEQVYEGAESILTENRAVLEESAAALLENETLAEKDLQPLFAKVAKRDTEASPLVGSVKPTC
jgi:cell division protease FtsH